MGFSDGRGVRTDGGGQGWGRRKTRRDQGGGPEFRVRTVPGTCSSPRTWNRTKSSVVPFLHVVLRSLDRGGDEGSTPDPSHCSCSTGRREPFDETVNSLVCRYSSTGRPEDRRTEQGGCLGLWNFYEATTQPTPGPDFRNRQHNRLPTLTPGPDVPETLSPGSVLLSSFCRRGAQEPQTNSEKRSSFRM